MMNQKDGQAFSLWHAMRSVARSVIQPGEEWQAALKYARAEQEPIYIVGKGWQCDDMPPAGTKLYTEAPAVAVNEQLLEAAELLLQDVRRFQKAEGSARFSVYASMLEAAIAAAEAQQGKGE